MTVHLVFSVWVLKMIAFGTIGAFAMILLSLSGVSGNRQTIQAQSVNAPIAIVPNYPSAIVIPKVGLTLSIKEATVSGNTWQIFDEAASWLNTSGTFDKGNIVLYGHNKADGMGKITQLGAGDEILLKNSNKEVTYTVEKVFETTSTDLAPIQNADNKLTIYTCSGWFDAKRFFVVASPK